MSNMLVSLGYAYVCVCVFVCVLTMCNLLILNARLELNLEHDKTTQREAKCTMD